MENVVEEALRDWEDRIFWAEVQSAFEAPEPEEFRKERELWERTAADGLAPTPRARRPRGQR